MAKKKDANTTPKTPKEACLFPECGQESKTRGLCAKHYSAAASLVKNGKVSWDTLENAGKVLRTSKESSAAYFLG